MTNSKIKIVELIPDNKNVNKGSEFGNALLSKSIGRNGLGRSILLDKNNRIIAGNKTVENAGALGIEDVQIVETDGKRIIAVKRMDIDLDSKAGRELALADNIVSKHNYVEDAEVLEAVVEEYNINGKEWGIEGAPEASGGPGKIKKENITSFQKTHILLSFHPQLMLKIQKHLEEITKIEGVEYEQSSN
jgi:hypothetical protein